ncbi:MAG TPA: hypothetical protein ENI99_04205 [Sedimenticola sp.]|nr:hypothetical protein [Sedimenticola sp.]
MMKMHWVMKIAGLSAGMILSAAAVAGPLLNGDFSSGTNGFESWKGELDNGGPPVVSLTTDADFGTYSTSYSASAGAATLTNDNGDDFYHVSLFQSFDVPVTAGTLALSLDYEWSVSSLDDLVQASLEDSSSVFYDLFAGLTPAMTASGTINYDITGLAGDTVELYFLVEDADWVETDWLRVGNITITETLSVPAPPVLVLLLAGLAGLAYRRCR